MRSRSDNLHNQLEVISYGEGQANGNKGNRSVLVLVLTIHGWTHTQIQTYMHTNALTIVVRTVYCLLPRNDTYTHEHKVISHRHKTHFTYDYRDKCLHLPFWSISWHPLLSSLLLETIFLMDWIMSLTAYSTAIVHYWPNVTILRCSFKTCLVLLSINVHLVYIVDIN